jgi:ribosomal protein L7/L12
MPDITFWIALSILGMLMIMAIVQGRAKDQLGRVERKLDALLKHSGIDLAAGADREVVELMKAGRKIEAIRLHRERTGAGLAEAKKHVEELERRA